jgi:ribosomal protein S21
MKMNEIEVRAREGERIDSLLARFKRTVVRSRVLKFALEKQSYMKPSALARKKRKARKKIVRSFGQKGLGSFISSNRVQNDKVDKQTISVSEPLS